jgi:hypothetical protein
MVSKVRREALRPPRCEGPGFCLLALFFFMLAVACLLLFFMLLGCCLLAFFFFYASWFLLSCSVLLTCSFSGPSHLRGLRVSRRTLETPQNTKVHHLKIAGASYSAVDVLKSNVPRARHRESIFFRSTLRVFRAGGRSQPQTQSPTRTLKEVWGGADSVCVWFACFAATKSPAVISCPSPCLPCFCARSSAGQTGQDGQDGQDRRDMTGQDRTDRTGQTVTDMADRTDRDGGHPPPLTHPAPPNSYSPQRPLNGPLWELGTRNSELGTRNSELGTRNWELGTGNSELGTGAYQGLTRGLPDPGAYQIQGGP